MSSKRHTWVISRRDSWGSREEIHMVVCCIGAMVLDPVFGLNACFGVEDVYHENNDYMG